MFDKFKYNGAFQLILDRPVPSNINWNAPLYLNFNTF